MFAIQTGFYFNCCKKLPPEVSEDALSAVLNLTFLTVHVERNGHLY